jgi:predicted nucleotidyltransferase
LFGSRATGTAQPASDFDVAVLADEDISRELSVARDRLEESNIPFKVDLVDLRLATPAFRRAAQAQGVLLWKN